MQPNPTLAELMRCLSVATDFAMGHAQAFGWRSAHLALALARRMGWNAEDCTRVYYQALLRYIGCNVETSLMASLLGDEIELRREMAPVDMTDKASVMRVVWRRLSLLNQHRPWPSRMVATLRTMATLEPAIARQFEGHCEVGQRLAMRIGLPSDVVLALGQLYERWDGRGQPAHLRGESVAPAVLLVALSQDVLVHADLDGAEAALRMARKRRGAAYAPTHVDALEQAGSRLVDEAVASMAAPDYPGPDEPVDDERLDQICAAMADFADIKSPFTLGHSSGVAALAGQAAELAGFDAQRVRTLRRAAWLHDIGKVGISAAVWCKPGLLNVAEREQVRLHAYYTERILDPVAALAPVAQLASLTHDRLDGSGYFRRPPASALSRDARLLAAADAAHGWLEARPHRAALSPAQVVARLRDEAGAGRLDAWACEQVGAALGQARTGRKAGDDLTDREADVLRCIARGLATKEIARELAIAVKTVDHHQQRIFAKLGVRTRGAAMLRAMEQGYCDRL